MIEVTALKFKNYLFYTNLEFQKLEAITAYFTVQNFNYILDLN
jgi:hypothetical protein